MISLRNGMTAQEQQRQDADMARRERVADLIEKRHPKTAAKIRAGMRSSNWPEDLIDPGYLLDLLEKIES